MFTPLLPAIESSRVRSLLGAFLLFFSVSFEFSVNVSIPRLNPTHGVGDE